MTNPDYLGMTVDQTAEAILIAHQRRDVGSCLCGWSELGKSYAGHQVAMLCEAGLLNDVPEWLALAARDVLTLLRRPPST